MKRRTFLKVAGGMAGSGMLRVHPVLASESEAAKAQTGIMQLRPLGRLGWKVSVVAFSGLGLRQFKDDEQSLYTAAVRNAFDRGLNYYDVAPAYENGRCETRMGVGLQDIQRDKYFLACKTKRRDKDGCREELEQSLKLLKTDYFDVYQLHHLVQPDDVKKALGPGGAMETILKAKEEGKIRAIGFSAHTTQAALEAMNGFDFDTVMFPINYVEYYSHGFGQDVLELAEKKKTAVLSIKTMNAGTWKTGEERVRKWWYKSLELQEDINLAYRWTLSLPGVVMGFPPSWMDLQSRAIDAGLACRPATEADVKKLQEMAKGCGSIFQGEKDKVKVAMHSECPCHSSEYWA